MVSLALLQKLALSFPETSEEPHFEKTSFRVKKKIFATYNHQKNRACVKLSAIDQQVFCMTNKEIIYPVDSKWAKQGWTLISMEQVREEVFIDAVTTAYCEVAPPKLSQMVRGSE
jgi:predicted DNA-binding protein (MmcQ/YjbR family)